MNKIFERKIVNIFLPVSLNVSFGFSKEPSHCKKKSPTCMCNKVTLLTGMYSYLVGLNLIFGQSTRLLLCMEHV